MAVAISNVHARRYGGRGAVGSSIVAAQAAHQTATMTAASRIAA
ncbi:hypothetical protein [Amycolatopsis panacis]|nr:hypothetical protein [Amycolatopsis panacis]